MKARELKIIADGLAKEDPEQEAAVILIDRETLFMNFPKLKIEPADADRLLSKLQNRLNQHMGDDYSWEWEIEDILSLEKDGI